MKVGQEDYRLDHIARDHEEYFSGHGESPGRYVGSAATTSGLGGIASAEQVRAMLRGQDPATGEQRCQPLLRADPRSKLAAGPLLAALREHAAAQGVTELAELAPSKALAGDVRAIVAACRAGGARRVKVETAERRCRMLLRVDPRSLYGEAFDAAWQHRGRRIDARVAAFDLSFSSPKSVSLLAAGGSAERRQQVNKGPGDRAGCRSCLTGSPRGGRAPGAQRHRPPPGPGWRAFSMPNLPVHGPAWPRPGHRSFERHRTSSDPAWLDPANSLGQNLDP